MRTEPINPGEYYHILNRGNNKQLIFLDAQDWARFLFLIIYMQSPIIFPNISRHISYYIKNKTFNISRFDTEEIIKSRNVDLINFALMPNHFHLTVYELKQGGIANYMQRVLCAYTKYFNTKYGKCGHLFQGPYKAIHVKDNEQLLYLSTYIHNNPREISEWKNKEHMYPWSSYQDYLGVNRWGKLIRQGILLDQFKNKEDYITFIKSSPAKKVIENIDTELLIDAS